METPIQTTTRKTSAAKLSLVGLLLTLAGGISYFLLMSVPWIRTHAIPNIALAIVGIALCTFALKQRRTKLIIAASAVSYLVAIGFLLSIFVLMRLPAPQTTFAAGQSPPEFTLPNQDGQSISLASYRNKGPVLLVFYRGFW